MVSWRERDYTVDKPRESLSQREVDWPGDFERDAVIVRRYPPDRCFCKFKIQGMQDMEDCRLVEMVRLGFGCPRIGDSDWISGFKTSCGVEGEGSDSSLSCPARS